MRSVFAMAGHAAGTLHVEEFERLEAYLVIVIGLNTILTLWILPGVVVAVISEMLGQGGRGGQEQGADGGADEQLLHVGFPRLDFAFRKVGGDPTPGGRPVA